MSKEDLLEEIEILKGYKLMYQNLNEQNKRYREAIDKIAMIVNEHLSDGTEINPYRIDDVVDELEELE